MINIEQKPRIVGVAGTILFWALFLVLSTVFSLFVRKPPYKTVQIRLDSPQTKTQEARAAAALKAAEPVAQSAPSASPPPAPAKATPPAPAKSAQTASKPAATQPAATKTQPQKTPAPKKTAPEPVLQKSVEELMAEQAANRPKKQMSQADIDALFADSDEVTSTQTNTVVQQTQTVQNALAGSAGSANTSTNTAASATSAKNSASQAASTGTSTALGNIANQSKVDGGGVSATATDTGSRQTNGNADIRFTSGAGRRLLSSAKIALSAEAQKAVTGQAQMQISFTVRADGTVTNVIIPSYLPQNVRQEIALQISRWQFSAGTGNDTAVFTYKITE